MTVETVKARRYTCDGCGKVVFSDLRAVDPVIGWHGGKVMCHAALGGSGTSSWFACSDECIKNAVVNACFGSR